MDRHRGQRHLFQLPLRWVWPRPGLPELRPLADRVENAELSRGNPLGLHGMHEGLSFSKWHLPQPGGDGEKGSCKV